MLLFTVHRNQVLSIFIISITVPIPLPFTIVWRAYEQGILLLHQSAVVQGFSDILVRYVPARCAASLFSSLCLPSSIPERAMHNVCACVRVCVCVCVCVRAYARVCRRTRVRVLGSNSTYFFPFINSTHN